MVYSFKRASLLPVVFIACGCIMLCTSLITITFGSFAAIINVGLSILFIGQGVWHFSTPIIKIENGVLYHKKGILANEDLELVNVEKVVFPNDSRVDLIFYNGHVEKIYLRNMARDSRDEFRSLMAELVNQPSKKQ